MHCDFFLVQLLKLQTPASLVMVFNAFHLTLLSMFGCIVVNVFANGPILKHDQFGIVCSR